MSWPNPLDELRTLLISERELLLTGRFVELADLQDRKIGYLDSLKLGAANPKVFAALLEEASANQRLMEAASAGTRAAIQRVAELSRLEAGQGVYGRNGIPRTTIPVPRVLRRL